MHIEATSLNDQRGEPNAKKGMRCLEKEWKKNYPDYLNISMEDFEMS